MAINTQKFLPGSGGTTKSVPQAKISSITLTSQDKKSVNTIRVRTIQIDKMLKGTLAADKKKLTDKKKEASQKRKEDIETGLEKKPDTKKITMPKILPRTGILDWIKNFIGNILLGYFAVRLLKHLPVLQGIFTTIVSVGEFIINWGGKLLNAVVTFVDWGYKLYDGLRQFTDNIFGKSGLKVFDTFMGTLNKVLNAVIVIALAFGRIGINPFNWGKGGGGGSWKNRGGGGRSNKVTTSGGKTVPRTRGFKFKLPKGLRGFGGFLGKITKVLLLWELYETGKKVFNPEDNIITAVANLGIEIANAFRGEGDKIKQVGGSERTKRINKQRGFAKGGRVKKATRTITPRRGFVVAKKKRPIKDIRPVKIEPGENIVDKKEGGFFSWIKNIFGSVVDTFSPLKFFKDYGDKFGAIPFFGPIISLAVQALVGQKPGDDEYKNAGRGIISLIAKGLNMGKLIGSIGGVGFAAGGLVDKSVLMKESKAAEWLGKELKKSLTPIVNETISEIEKNLGKQEKPDPPGGGGGDGSGSVSGNDQQKARKMYDYLMRKPGMTHNKAAGIVANIKFESGFRTSVMGDNGTSGGLFQMHAGRLTRMENAVPNWKNNWKGQIDYALKDDRGPEYMNMTFNSAGDAANWWMRNWERPAEELRNTREHNQRQWIKKINWQGKSGQDASKGPGLFPLDYRGQTSSSGDASSGSKIAGELGHYLKANLRQGPDFEAVTEHSQHGGVRGRHAKNSYHYSDRAIDIGAWAHEQPKILSAIEKFNRLKGVSPVELLHAGNRSDHRDHVHVAYHKGGQVPGKGERWARLLGGEMVIDIDSAGPAKDLLLAINQASGRDGVMKAIRDYAPYEAIQSRMIPVPVPKMVPVPVPMGSSGGGGTVVIGDEDPFKGLAAIG